MANMIIAAAHAIAGITGGNNPAATSVANLNKIQPTDVWRSDSLSNLSITMDLGIAQPVNVVALLFTNTTINATWRIRGATTESRLDNSRDFSTGFEQLWFGDVDNVGRPHGMLWLPSAKTYRWWRIEITDSGNPDGWVEAGRVFLSNAFQPTHNYKFGSGRGYKDTSVQRESYGGQLHFTPGAQRPLVSLTTGMMARDEVEGDYLELQRLGAPGPFLVAMNPIKRPLGMSQLFYGLAKFDASINEVYGKFESHIVIDGMI